MQPTVGRIVHFYPDSRLDPQAAIVARINRDGTLNLDVSPDGEARSGGLAINVPQHAEGADRFPCWSWPPRAEAPAATIETKPAEAAASEPSAEASAS